MALFCVAQSSPTETLKTDDLPPEITELFGNNVAEIFENTVKLLMWIFRRYYEVMIFRSLQNALNRLESFSASKLSYLARAILAILHMEQLKLCKVEDTFIVSMRTTC